MKQKMVIKVQMANDKCRSKAMALVAGTGGVDSVSMAGEKKDQLVVVGDGVDPIKLTTLLRKKVGAAQLVQVAEVKEEKKKPAAAADTPWRYYHHYATQPAQAPVVYEQYNAGTYGYGYGYQW